MGCTHGLPHDEYGRFVLCLPRLHRLGFELSTADEGRLDGPSAALSSLAGRGFWSQIFPLFRVYSITVENDRRPGPTVGAVGDLSLAGIRTLIRADSGTGSFGGPARSFTFAAQERLVRAGGSRRIGTPLRTRPGVWPAPLKVGPLNDDAVPGGTTRGPPSYIVPAPWDLHGLWRPLGHGGSLPATFRRTVGNAV